MECIGRDNDTKPTNLTRREFSGRREVASEAQFSCGDIKSQYMHPDCNNRTYSPTKMIEAEIKIGEVVLGLATSHGRKIAGTFTPPCCLVFVGQDRQSWVPGPLRNVMAYIRFPKGRRKVEVLHLFRWFTHTHTHSDLTRMSPQLFFWFKIRKVLQCSNHKLFRLGTGARKWGTHRLRDDGEGLPA